MKILKYIFLWIISFIVFMYGSFILVGLLSNNNDNSEILIGIYSLGATIITCTYLIINSLKQK
ncbi:conserved hypothetical protein [Clostridiaceae bacterium BL-3]|nr:conserved hypothetical protein [Clostridiaceae bacterium BL-3]